MKLVALICLLLCTIVTESRHLQKRDADRHSRRLGGMYLALGKNTFNNLVLVMLAQDLQKCTLEQLLEIVGEISDTAQHCADHEEEVNCQKSMTTLYYDKVCQIPNLENSYAWSTECCAKVEPEREKCYHDHRDIPVAPYKRPDTDAACKKHTEHPKQAFESYAYDTARRHSSIPPPAILAFARQYNTIITDCCAVEEKEKCFEPKFTEVLKASIILEHRLKQVCNILSTFPEKVSKDMKLVHLSQKYPGANYEDLKNIASESVQWSKVCCNGDVVECMLKRMELNQHVCDIKEKISPNLNACCEKSVLERTPCFMALPKDDPPADLSKDLNEFAEDEHVCEHFAEKESFLSKFLYEYSRRQQDLPSLTCLRVRDGYEGLLTKCCAAEKPAECYKAAPQMLEAGIKEAKDLAKQNCEAHKKLGDYGYQTVMLSRYVPKMPEVSDATLLEITAKMTKFAAKCCAMPESQVMSCGEEKLDFLLGEMCERQKVTFINDQVRHCCTASYAGRRPCFTKLGPDPSYKPPAFDESAFHADAAGICTGPEEQRFQKRHEFLIHFLKLKPDMSHEKMKECIDEFTKVRETCCVEDDPQSCFDTKRAAVLLHVKGAIAH